MALNILHVRDERAPASNGGTALTGWRTRPINTEVTNEIAGASLATNQITLPAGTYFVDAVFPNWAGGLHKSSWYNVTDVAHEIIGLNWHEAGGNMAHGRVRGRFTIAAEKVFEVRQYTGTQQNTNGFGADVNDGAIEIYADVRIWEQP